MRVVMLVNTLRSLDENHALLANAFIRRGWEVGMADVNRMYAIDYRYFATGALLPPGHDKYDAAMSIDEPPQAMALAEAQLVWVLNQPQPSVAKDVWQMLWLASQTVKFVNSIDGLMFLNTKHSLGYVLPPENRTSAYISNDFHFLWQRYREQQQARWVAKPLNSGCGQDVFLLPSDGSNVRTILQSLTGNTVAEEEMSEALGGFRAQYALLQGYIDEVKQGEKRIIVACDQVVAWHGRKPQVDDHRSNITQGGTPVEVALSDDERSLAQLIGRKLAGHGVHFCGIDMAFPYVLELNIANPGGLGDYRLVSGKDMSDEVVNIIVRRFGL